MNLLSIFFFYYNDYLIVEEKLTKSIKIDIYIHIGRYIDIYIDR